MAQGYTIWAYSPSLNIEHRLLELSNLTPIQSQTEAQLRANIFAETYNRNKKQHAEDWVGRIKYEQTGLETLPGYNPNLKKI